MTDVSLLPMITRSKAAMSSAAGTIQNSPSEGSSQPSNRKRRASTVDSSGDEYEERIGSDALATKKRVRLDREPKGRKASGGGSSVKQKRPRTAGMLEKFTTLPIELLLLTFGFLHPYDLLRLSRTTKSLRSLLMSRNSRPAWVQSLSTIPDLPECPADLAEPTFVRLAFEPRCFKCHSLGVRTVYWELYLRACSNCVKTDSEDIVHLSSNDLQPLQRFFSEDELCDVVRCSMYDRGRDRISFIFFRRECDALLDFITSHDSNIDHPEVQSYINRETERVDNIQDWANECEAWYGDMQAQRSDELTAVRDRRREAIFERLRVLGYEEEIEILTTAAADTNANVLLGGLNDKHWMKDPKELTERSWKAITKSATADMDVVRKRLAADRELQVYSSRFIVLSAFARGLLDRLEEFAWLPLPRKRDILSVKEYVESPRIIGRPLPPAGAEDLTEANLLDMMQAVAEVDQSTVALSCIKSCKRRLADALRTDGYDMPADPDAALSLATSLFICITNLKGHSARCLTSIMQYQEALAHQCPRLPAGDDIDAEVTRTTMHWYTDDRAEWRRLAAEQTYGPEERIVRFTAASAKAAEVVTMAGLDPATATFDDMDDLDPWFLCTCRTCTHLGGEKVGEGDAYDWRHAVQHTLHYKPRWRRLTTEEAAVPREDRDSTYCTLDCHGAHPSHMAWRCHRCGRSPMSADQLREHLLKRHDVAAPVAQVDYTESRSCFVPHFHPVTLATKSRKKKT